MSGPTMCPACMATLPAGETHWSLMAGAAGGYGCGNPAVPPRQTDCDHTCDQHQTLVARVRAAEAVVEEARLVGQWHDAVDPMPEELRGELQDLWDHARAALATAQGGES